MLATHRAHGTTTMVASLVTDTTERLEASVRALAPLVDDGELAGIHLEGPWLSGAHCGAHDPALLRAPDPAEVARLLDAGAGAVRMVTLAPELDGGLDVGGPARRARGHRRARAQRRDVRRGARGARRRRHRRDAPVQRDAADAPPRARTGARARRGPAGVRRADRRRRPPAPGGAALGRGHRRRTASSSSPTRWARPAPATATTCSARGRRRCATAWPGWRRTGRSPAAPSPWTAPCGTPCRRPACRSTPSSTRRRPPRPGCSGSPTSASSSPAAVPTSCTSTRSSGGGGHARRRVAAG